MVKIENKIYEAHLAPTKTVKDYEIRCHQGDEVEITGIKTIFQSSRNPGARNQARHRHFRLSRPKGQADLADQRRGRPAPAGAHPL